MEPHKNDVALSTVGTDHVKEHTKLTIAESPTLIGERTDGSDFQDVQSSYSEGNAKSDGTLHALSGLYAQIIVVVAAILVFTELLHGPVPLFFFHGYLYTYLVGGGIICFLGAYASMLTKKLPSWSRRRFEKTSERSLFAAQFVRNLFFSDISIYLRIGAVVFGLGALISSGLEVASIFTMSQNCMNEINMAQPLLRGLFSFIQMHFLFMNTKDLVDSFRWFRHAALMHLVATNVAIWIRLMLWESAKDWLDAIHYKHNSSIKWGHVDFNITKHSLESDSKHYDPSHHKVFHKVHIAPQCLWNAESSETEDLIAFNLCLKNSTIGTIWAKAMPYLYPFIIQYCLVAAGVLYITWSNLHSHRLKLQRFSAASVYGRDNRDDELSCSGSTRGLFLGLLVLVAGIIVLILFFVLKEDENFNVIILLGSLECGVFGISALAAIIGLIQIRKMKSKTSRQRRLSELLQRVGMLAVYIFGICNMIVGGISILNPEHCILFAEGTLMVIQACLQSLFIHQVSKKRLSPLNEDQKPGRQVVIFLVFSNIVLWLIESFSTQNQIRCKLQLSFYGEVAWPVLTRIIFPFVIFYRFHSAVVLMEAWRKSYKVKHN